MMEQGHLVLDGKTDDVISAYMSKGTELAIGGPTDRLDREGKGDVWVTAINLRDERGAELAEAIAGKNIVLSVHYSVKTGMTLNDCIVCVEIHKDLRKFFTLSSALVDKRKLQLSGDGRIDFLVPDWPLSGGSYNVDTYIESDRMMQDRLDDASVIEVIDGDFFGSGKLHHEGWQGTSVLVRHSWSLQPGG